MNCITLLTDFGLADEYVGVMKGVILTIHPQVAIIDISHQIPPQDIAAGARMLAAVYRYFPKNTVHLCVVDPGVGTDRVVVAAHANDHFFVAPDNGLLFPTLKGATVREIVSVENSDFYLPEPSSTFHGRDIMAPAAAHLLRGVAIAALGRFLSLEELVPLELSTPLAHPDGSLTGTIIGTDRFGNLTTDIEHRHIDQLAGAGKLLDIEVGRFVISGLSENYAAAEGKTCLAIIGSRGYLEIAASGGSAFKRLAVKIGDPVKVRIG